MRADGVEKGVEEGKKQKIILPVFFLLNFLDVRRSRIFLKKIMVFEVRCSRLVELCYQIFVVHFDKFVANIPPLCS